MKKVTAAICAAILLVLFSVPAYAFPSQTHDSHLETALFGPDGLETNDEKALDAFEALKHASYLCIDQYNGGGQEMHLDALLEIQGEYWVDFLPTRGNYPKSIADIDYQSNYAHRAYTHLGWDYEYQEYNQEKVPDWLSSRWPKRQDLLRSTVEAVFDFNSWPFSIESPTGENICELIYYIHILGDHIYFEDYSTYIKTAKFICPLGGYDNKTTIIDELTEELDELFSTDASELIRKLETIDMDLRAICDADGIVSEANFQQYQTYAKEVLEVLSSDLPGLLKMQPYFSDVFY